MTEGKKDSPQLMTYKRCRASYSMAEMKPEAEWDIEPSMKRYTPPEIYDEFHTIADRMIADGKRIYRDDSRLSWWAIRPRLRAKAARKQSPPPQSIEEAVQARRAEARENGCVLIRDLFVQLEELPWSMREHLAREIETPAFIDEWVQRYPDLRLNADHLQAGLRRDNAYFDARKGAMALLMHWRKSDGVWTDEVIEAAGGSE